MSKQAVSQKDYLKKYLSTSSGDKKRKKRSKEKPRNERFRIIDSDVDLENMRPLEEDELDRFALAEEAPQIAGIIDERPEELRTLDQFRTKRWKVVTDESGLDDIKVIDLNRASTAEEVGKRLNITADLSPVRKSRSCGSPDISPPRREPSPVLARDGVDSEFTKSKSQNKDCDESLVKTEPLDSDESPPRKSIKLGASGEKISNLVSSSMRTSKMHDGDDLSAPSSERISDLVSSPTKSKIHADDDPSPPRKPKKHGSSPCHKSKRHHSDDSHLKSKPKRSEFLESPPRHSNKSDEDKSPTRKHMRNVDSNESLNRNNRKSGDSQSKQNKRQDHSDNIPTKRPNECSPSKTKPKEDSDESHPRKPRRSDSKENTNYSKPVPLSRPPHHSESSNIRGSHPHTKHSKTLPSPSSCHHSETSKRLDSHHHPRVTSSGRRSRFTDADTFGSDSDSVLAQKVQMLESSKVGRNCSVGIEPQSTSEFSSRVHDKGQSQSSRASSGHKSGKHTDQDVRREKSNPPKDRTLDGRSAGLQDAKELRKEISEMKQKERDMFGKMNSSQSGKDAAPIMRDRKTGKRRDLEQEAKEKESQEKKQAAHHSKYVKWGKGLKQVEDQTRRLNEDLVEMSKPLSRYADDVDLDRHLRDQEREGDPMLEYLRTKSKDFSGKQKPKYKGSFMPNRFGIQPGHRWDGVDRSNGFEKEFFDSKNAKRATEEEAYRWSTSDM